jgi:ribosome biogenesis SPOUT family RNA methylase Rps3
MKTAPKIIVPFDDKQRFKDLVLNVIEDSWIYTVAPNSISLDGVLFTLTLSNKKFVFEDIKVDGLSDYIDVYLQGIKKASNTYEVIDNGNDIIISFNQTITLRPQDIVKEDFLIKGKIVNR